MHVPIVQDLWLLCDHHEDIRCWSSVCSELNANSQLPILGVSVNSQNLSHGHVFVEQSVCWNYHTRME